MRRKDVKTVIAYYFGIPAMRVLLADERAELEDEYNGLHGTSVDGVPHSSTPGNPTETLAVRVDAPKPGQTGLEGAGGQVRQRPGAHRPLL